VETSQKKSSGVFKDKERLIKRNCEEEKIKKSDKADLRGGRPLDHEKQRWRPEREELSRLLQEKREQPWTLPSMWLQKAQKERTGKLQQLNTEILNKKDGKITMSIVKEWKKGGGESWPRRTITTSIIRGRKEKGKIWNCRRLLRAKSVDVSIA